MTLKSQAVAPAEAAAEAVIDHIIFKLHDLIIMILDSGR